MRNYHFYGKLCSLFYEIDKPFPNEEELKFYLSFANKKMNILEPMCGTGRFLAGFVEKGFNIDGFDISKEMLKICRTKIKKLFSDGNNLIHCCSFNRFPLNKKYDYIFIPSGSFSLVINREDIIENINILDGLCRQNGKIVIELLINQDIEKTNISNDYSESKAVKLDNIKIELFQKIIEINRKENIEYSMFKYILYENGKYKRMEEEKFNIKYYKPNEFEKYLEGTSLKIENTYINHEKEKYVNQNTEVIIYEIIKK